MVAALAEFERSLIVERTQAGLAATKARGAKLRRRKKLSPRRVEHGRALLEGRETGRAVANPRGITSHPLPCTRSSSLNHGCCLRSKMVGSFTSAADGQALTEPKPATRFLHILPSLLLSADKSAQLGQKKARLHVACA